MKTYTTVLLVLTLTSVAMGQNISWVKHMGGIAGDEFSSACSDTMDNLYITGSFTGPYGIFGNDSLPNPNPSYYSTFVSKLDPNGEFQWAIRAGGSFIPGNGLNDMNSICYDEHSNRILVWSRLSGFNPIMGSCALDGTGEYLSSIDTDGNCHWSTGQQNCELAIMTSDGMGAIYVLIRTSISGGQLNGVSIEGGWHLAKLRADDGATIWKKRLCSDDEASYSGLKLKGGHLYLSGFAIETEWMLDTTGVDNYPFDIVVAKYDTSGTMQWVKTFGGEGFDSGGRLDLDGLGDIYLTGSYSGTAYFDNETFLVNEDDDRNFFAAKLNTDGDLLWVVDAPTQGILYTRFTEFDGSGNLICGGTLKGSMDLNGQIVASDDEIGMVIRLDPEGGHLSTLSFLVRYEAPITVHVTRNGLVYLVSAYNQETTLGHFTVPTFGGRDILVARLDYTTGGPEARLINNELHIYANPSAGKCNITVPDEFLNEPQLTLRIMDMDGRLVSEQVLNMSSSKIGLNLEAEASGVYNISLSNGVKQYFGRAVFE